VVLLVKRVYGGKGYWGERRPVRLGDGWDRPPRAAVDHVVPLIDGGDKTLENLQLLCVPCHKVKTAREARVRAARRRGQTQLL
jgi:hypothetical protein